MSCSVQNRNSSTGCHRQLIYRIQNHGSVQCLSVSFILTGGSHPVWNFHYIWIFGIFVFSISVSQIKSWFVSVFTTCCDSVFIVCWQNQCVQLVFLCSGRAGSGRASVCLSLSLSLSLWSSASLCQLQRCPTFTCLPSLHLTACLKKINISAGEEKRRLPSEVFICAGRRRREQRERPVRETPGFWISSSSFSCLNQCSRLKQQPARQRSDQRGSRGQWYDWTKL